MTPSVLRLILHHSHLDHSFEIGDREIMPRDDYYTISSRDRSRKKRNLICVVGILAVTLIVGISVGLYFRNRKSGAEEHNLPNPTVDCSDSIPDEEKFDCYPDAPVNENQCAQRGCCFSTPKKVSLNDSLPPLNVPYCYYPKNYAGYGIKSISETTQNIKIGLQRITPSGFPNDSSNINIVISYIDDSSLRIKVSLLFKIFICNI